MQLLHPATPAIGGEREDLSGPVIEEMVTEQGYEVSGRLLLPDDKKKLSEAMAQIADEGSACLILTTGERAFSERD